MGKTIHSTVYRGEAAPIVRRIRVHRYLYMAGLGAGLLGLFLLVLNYVPNSLAALLLLTVGALTLYTLYGKVSLKNEASISTLLTQDMDPELFAHVYRQTLQKSRAFPSLQLMFDMTACFYLGQYREVVQTLPGTKLFSWTQPEFASYYVQAACALGLREEAEKGLSLFTQARSRREYEDAAVASLVDRYEHLARCAFLLLEHKASDALIHAQAVNDDEAAPELCLLYARGYLALIHSLRGEKSLARVYREQVESCSPAFGIVQHLRPGQK